MAMNDLTRTAARRDVREASPVRRAPLVTQAMLRTAVRDSFVKLDPRVQIRNPVMFVVLIGSMLTTLLGDRAPRSARPQLGGPGFVAAIAVWLWLTLLFANFAEALAEGRGKAQAAALRATRRERASAQTRAERSREQCSISCLRARCVSTTCSSSKPGKRYLRTVR